MHVGLTGVPTQAPRRGTELLSAALGLRFGTARPPEPIDVSSAKKQRDTLHRASRAPKKHRIPAETKPLRSHSQTTLGISFHTSAFKQHREGPPVAQQSKADQHQSAKERHQQHKPPQRRGRRSLHLRKMFSLSMFPDLTPRDVSSAREKEEDKDKRANRPSSLIIIQSNR